MMDVEIRHFHFFAGLGGGAKGFNRGRADLGKLRAKFRCIGGVDVSPAAMRDFYKFAGVQGTVMDLFDREQCVAFHGAEPPAEWREVTAQDIQRAAGGERPHIVFLSAPCKGFSGLLSETRSKTGKYQALNRLTLRGVWLMLEAWADDPPELIIFENVPRIATRGRALLDQIGALLRHYGYAVAETFHDCGEIGGLAQSRKRFLMVARYAAKVRPFLYEPPKRPLRAVGQILEKFPMPGDLRGGPMHVLPNLQWKTWVRLAFVEAGSDWRSLNKLKVEGGRLTEYAMAPEAWFGDTLGVIPWGSSAGTVTGMASPTRGAFSVADPRVLGQDYGSLAVRDWQDSTGTVTGQRSPLQGGFSVADPRLSSENGPRYNNIYRVIRWNEASQAVSGGTGPSAGGLNVADPRCANYSPSAHENKLSGVAGDRSTKTVTGGQHVQSGLLSVADPRPGWQDRFGALQVSEWQEPSSTVIAGGKGVQGGWLSVADPRIGLSRSDPYGVVPWDASAGAVIGSAHLANGRFSVADPRVAVLPAANQKLTAVIRSIDGTWHRPFTTLELAALQSLVDPDDIFDLDGEGDGAKRERIGNAVPAAAAQAIADLMGQTLLLAWSGGTFALSAQPIWVQPIAVALSVNPYRGIA